MMDRKRCVMEKRRAIQGTTKSRLMNNKNSQRLSHGVFMERIRKSMYFGYDTTVDHMEYALSRPLAQYASDTFSEPHKGHSLNRLSPVAAGNVETTPCSLIMALIYLDRINLTDPGYARRITPQELFIVSMMISTKFHADYDEQIYLSNWADDGNMTEDRLKQLELDFLQAINWKIYISYEQFLTKLIIVERILAQREGVQRGWLTYTELIQLLPSFTLIRFLLNNITVIAVSYAASVMTIAGAFFLASQVPGTSLHRATRTTTANDVTRSSTVPMSNVTIDQGGTILPAGRDDIIGDSESAALSTTTTTTDVITVVSQQNATCMALNVQLELLKLERKYRDDDTMIAVPDEDEFHHTQDSRSETSYLSRTLHPSDNMKESLNYDGELPHGENGDYYGKLNWMTWKEQYSDRVTDSSADAPHIFEWHNGTFWRYLSSSIMETQELYLMPWLWFKLI